MRQALRDAPRRAFCVDAAIWGRGRGDCGYLRYRSRAGKVKIGRTAVAAAPSGPAKVAVPDAITAPCAGALERSCFSPSTHVPLAPEWIRIPYSLYAARGRKKAPTAHARTYFYRRRNETTCAPALNIFPIPYCRP